MGRKHSHASSSPLVVGLLKINLLLPENHSLKGKRSVLKNIQARVGHQFNVSVTECDAQDLWQRAVLGFGVLGSDSQIVQATLQKITDFVDRLGLAELGESEVEIFHW